MHRQDPDPLPTAAEHNAIEPPDGMLSREQAFLQKAEQIIHANLGDSHFNVPAFADEVGLSVSQLNRRLNALIGQPAGALIRDVRLRFAAGLLASNAASVRVIAGRAGYKNQAHFCRSFKKQYGCPPSEYTVK